MKPRAITPHVFSVGVVDWDRRLFDSLIPLPDGTSYNSYLVKGSEKTALIDTVDPAFTAPFLEQLQGVDNIDYIVTHHAEQDHSGSLPVLLEKFPQARVVCSAKCRGMLIDHLGLGEERIMVVEDGQKLSLGDRTLTFIATPWVHWPETMCSWLDTDRILFSCDFFGSHLATSDLLVQDKVFAYEAAKRYYAEIMMPFRPTVLKNIDKISAFAFDRIAPSHGPVWGEPAFIIDAYREWVNETPKNEVVIPYISMHGSTRLMVEYLVAGLTDRGIGVKQFELAGADIGKLAIALVDAATIVIGTPTVHVGPHPMVFYAAHLANALRPKLRFASIIGSYGWASKAVERIAELIPNLKVEVLEPVMARGLPREADYAGLDRLIAAIAEKHRAAGLLPA